MCTYDISLLGTTATVVLITGPLVTVANIGDSAAIVDTGCSMLELTTSHRIHDSLSEQSRLSAARCQVAQVRSGDHRAPLDLVVYLITLPTFYIRLICHCLSPFILISKCFQLGFHLRGPAKAGEAGLGPLRMWPGALCVSRSIGDPEAGPEVIPLPHIKQVTN